MTVFGPRETHCLEPGFGHAYIVKFIVSADEASEWVDVEVICPRWIGLQNRMSRPYEMNIGIDGHP